jgi:ABC-type glycerol-3-phosphate transport system substrate-binding protein
LVEGAQRANGATVAPSLPDLAKRTAFAAGMAGPGGAASYGQVVALAIMKESDAATTEIAKAIAQYYLNEGYVEILATAPLGKVPVRQSVAQRWTTLSPLFANYSDATLGHIANGFDTVHRWVLRAEYSNSQRAVISEIESRLLIPQAIDKILSGGETPEEAAAWLQAQTEALVQQFSIS